MRCALGKQCPATAVLHPFHPGLHRSRRQHTETHTPSKSPTASISSSRLHCAQPLRRSLLARRRTSERLGTARPPFVLQRWPAHTSPCRRIRLQAPNEYGRGQAPTQGSSTTAKFASHIAAHSKEPC